MIANELADFVEISKPNDKAHQAIATMLRQQQALIEQFEKTQDYLYKTHDADKAEIEKLGSELNRIVELYTDKAIENEALHKKIIDLSFDLEYAKRTDEFVNWSEK